MSTPLAIKSRLWVVGPQGTFLGEGRISLLQAIGKLGSISKAAKSMNMSYLKAWKLVESMNCLSKKPLVVRTTGGKGGGGTVLTTEGENAIAFYKELTQKCQKFLDTELEQLNANRLESDFRA